MKQSASKFNYLNLITHSISNPMSDNSAALKTLSGQQLFTTSFAPGRKIATVQDKAIGKQTQPMAATTLQMSAATVTSQPIFQKYLQAQLGNEVHYGKKDVPHVPINIPTTSSVEQTMAAISEAQTMAAQKMSMMKQGDVQKVHSKIAHEPVKAGQYARTKGELVSRLLQGQKQNAPADLFIPTGHSYGSSLELAAEMRMQSEMAKAPVVSAVTDNQGQVLENFMDDMVGVVVPVSKPSLAQTKAQIRQQMAQGQDQSTTEPQKQG